MNNKYIIRWKSKVNGRSGRGTKLFDKETAEQLVEELNGEYPDIEHELVEIEPSPPQPEQPAPPPAGHLAPSFSMA